MIENALYSFLSAESTITDLVSTRIYPDELPENPTYPAITFGVDENFTAHDYNGMTDFAQTDFYFDAWAYDRSTAKAVSDALRALFKGHAGSTGGINIHQVHMLAGPVTVFEDSVKSYRMTSSYGFWHNEV